MEGVLCGAVFDFSRAYHDYRKRYKIQETRYKKIPSFQFLRCPDTESVLDVGPVSSFSWCQCYIFRTRADWFCDQRPRHLPTLHRFSRSVRILGKSKHVSRHGVVWVSECGGTFFSPRCTSCFVFSTSKFW